MRNLLKTLLWICFSLWYLNPIISIAMLASKKCWCKHKNINTFFGLKMYQNVSRIDTAIHTSYWQSFSKKWPIPRRKLTRHLNRLYFFISQFVFSFVCKRTICKLSIWFDMINTKSCYWEICHVIWETWKNNWFVYYAESINTWVCNGPLCIPETWLIRYSWERRTPSLVLCLSLCLSSTTLVGREMKIKSFHMPRFSMGLKMVV